MKIKKNSLGYHLTNHLKNYCNLDLLHPSKCDFNLSEGVYFYKLFPALFDLDHIRIMVRNIHAIWLTI